MELSSPRLLSLGSGDCGGGLLAVGRRLLLPLPLSSFAPVESLGIPLAPGAVGMPETEDFLISSLCVVKSPLGGTAGDCWAFSSSAGATGDLATTSGSRSSSSIGTRATSWSSTSELGPEEAPRSRAFSLFSPSSSSMGSFSSPAPISSAPSFAALAKVMDLSSSSNCFNSSASSLNSSDVNADCERTSSTLLFSSSLIAIVFSSSLTSVAVAVTAAVVAAAASPANAASLSSRSTSSVPAASPSPAASPPAAAASHPSTPSANVAVAVVVAGAASPAGGSTSVTGIEADDSTAFSATVDGSTNSNISVSAAGTVADLSPSFSASSSSPSFFFASTLEASS